MVKTTNLLEFILNEIILIKISNFLKVNKINKLDKKYIWKELILNEINLVKIDIFKKLNKINKLSKNRYF